MSLVADHGQNGKLTLVEINHQLAQIFVVVGRFEAESLE